MSSIPIGKQIKDRRKLLKITQQDLSEISRVSLRTVKAVELGKGNPTVEVLSRLLEPIGLRLTVEDRIRHE